MKRTLVMLAAVLLAAAHVSLAAAQTLNVPGDFPTIQDAIDAIEAGNPATVIEVEPDTYGAIDVKLLPITIRSTEGAAVTTIDAGGASRTIVGAPTGATIDGFTITAGAEDIGAGMLNNGENPTIRNCIFHNNAAMDSGGAMANINGANPLIVNCVFHSNSSDIDGGAIFNFESSPQIVNCTFTSNTAAGEGGAIANLDSSSVITNSILWDNSAAGADEISDVGGASSVTFSNVEGGVAGIGNIDADPEFVDAGANNFRLDGNSPCVDTGSDAAVPVGITTDLDGEPRIRGGRLDCIVDMGAYEHQPIHTVTPIASTKDGSIISFGSASINEDGSRVLYDTIEDDAPNDDKHHVNLMGIGPIAEIDAEGHAFIGGPAQQRQAAGERIAYTAKETGQPSASFVIDLADALPVPDGKNTGADVVAIGSYSFNGAGDFSFWQVRNPPGGALTQEIAQWSAADMLTVLYDALPGEYVMAPVRDPDGDVTLFLKRPAGDFDHVQVELHRCDGCPGFAPDPVYVAGDPGDRLEVSVPTIAGGNVAVFIDHVDENDDPVIALGIYVFDLAAGSPAGNLVVPLNGDLIDGFELAPSAYTRPHLNADGDVAFSAIDLADDLEKIFIWDGNGLEVVILPCADAIEGGEVRGDLQVLGLTDRDGTGKVQVLFRALASAAPNDPTWTAIALKSNIQLHSPVPPCPADLTGNGSVGVPDLLQLLACWGPVAPGCEDADLTGNGSVGVPDLLDLLSQWGPCPQ